jgi:hypothetical protein
MAAARRYGEGKAPHRTMRVERDLWLPFGVNCERVNTDMSSAVREFIAWFNREPGAKLPKRPDTPLTPQECEAVLSREHRGSSPNSGTG